MHARDGLRTAWVWAVSCVLLQPHCMYLSPCVCMRDLFLCSTSSAQDGLDFLALGLVTRVAAEVSLTQFSYGSDENGRRVFVCVHVCELLCLKVRRLWVIDQIFCLQRFWALPQWGLKLRHRPLPSEPSSPLSGQLLRRTWHPTSRPLPLDVWFAMTQTFFYFWAPGSHKQWAELLPVNWGIEVKPVLMESDWLWLLCEVYWSILAPE